MEHQVLLLLMVVFAFAECGRRLTRPTLSWKEKTIALVEVKQETNALVELSHQWKPYNQVVKKKDAANFSISWKTELHCALSTRVPLAATSDVIKLNHGGRYQLVVEICSKYGCVSSDPADIIVADTDGSHLPPQNFVMKRKNKPFKQTSGKVVAAYFVEWSDYVTSIFSASSVPVPNLTHLLYGFIPICTADVVGAKLRQLCSDRQDSQVTIGDTFAAFQLEKASPKEYYAGNFGQLIKLKVAQPDLNILASIGGWELSDPFFFFATKAKRDRFVASVKDFLKTWKFFDGVVIDWEHPGGKGKNHSLGSTKDGETYVFLMQELREMLNNLSTETYKLYELTSVVSAGCDMVKVVNYTEAQKYIDYLFLMSRDFKGSYPNNNLGYQTPLYAPEWNPNDNYTTDAGVKCMLAQGVDSKKIVIGAIMYGRKWTGVQGYTNNNPFTGKASGPDNGSWEHDSMEYGYIADQIAQGTMTYYYNDIAKAPYVFNETTGELISYDDIKSVMEKTKYVNNNNLGGLFAYRLDADNGDLLNAMNEGLGNRY